MKKLTLVFVLLILGVSLVSCSEQSLNSNIQDLPKGQYTKISAEDAKKIIDSGYKIKLVDVRTEGEFSDGHIKGAILIPNETIGKERPKQLPNLDDKILVYCRSGRRSEEAANKLIEMGYTDVYDFGGIIDWNYEIVSD